VARAAAQQSLVPELASWLLMLAAARVADVHLSFRLKSLARQVIVASDEWLFS
jgi:hypothetical protein